MRKALITTTVVDDSTLGSPSYFAQKSSQRILSAGADASWMPVMITLGSLQHVR